jgi:type VI secretion system protein
VTLTLEIISTTTGMPSVRQRSFREDGGRLGRDKSNDWVLPHAKVSSRHAVISYRNGVFYIEDRSRNGVFLNSTTNRLAPGKPQALQSGDVIFIEPYEIQVSITEEAGDSAIDYGEDADPFAERPLMPPAAYVPPPPAHAEPVPGDDEFNYEVDPLKLLGGSGNVGAPRSTPNKEAVHLEDLERRPLAGVYQPPRIVTPPPIESPPRVSREPEAVLIPEDYDPLKDDIVAEPPAGDPFAPESPRARVADREPAFERESPPEIVEAAEVIDPFMPPPSPAVRPTPVFEDEAEDVTPPVPAARKTPPPVVPAQAIDAADLPIPVIASSDVAPIPSPAAPPAPEPAHSTPPPVAKRDEATPDPRERTPVRGSDLATVLAGAGLKNVDVTPELAESFGRILTTVVSGVMDLLRARQQVKDELRMRQTQFRPADNNPLKFSANVEDALHNLLVKQNAAYLRPVDAFADAFDDLRDHQLAMLAGLRVAFEAMLAEFDPARLEEQFDRHMKKGSLLSVPAKMRYWDAYRDRAEQLLKDMDATFRKWFGEEFVKAYEEQLERLETERRERTP